MHTSLKYVGVVGVCAIASVTYVANSAVDTSSDKYTVKIPGGIAFSDFRGYENWQVVSGSESGGKFAVIVGNPIAIKAYKEGIPANGKPFPEGAKLAKIHWTTKKRELFPAATVPDTQLNADFMEKDSKRFADSNGWGYGAFEYDNSSDKFRPATTTDMPAQGNDAKCGAACHTIAKADDFVFTEYAKR